MYYLFYFKKKLFIIPHPSRNHSFRLYLVWSELLCNQNSLWLAERNRLLTIWEEGNHKDSTNPFLYGKKEITLKI